MTDKSNWEAKGGTLEIPDGWFVDHANFDVEEPYIIIFPGSEPYTPNGKKLFVPKSLAYFLSVHFCGSEKMSEMLTESGRMEIQIKIKRALGIEE
jgi:chaperone required for assembly of F1-ATPase